MSALFTSWAAFLVFSAVNALVLGLEALKIARSHALNPCFLTTSHTVACCSRLAPLTPAHQPTIYFVQNLFSLFAALRFEYKAHFLFVGFFFLQLQTVCLRVCVRPSDTTEFHTPFEYRGVVNQAAAPLAACSIRILRPNADKRLHVEPQANWQRRRQRTAFEASASSLRL